MNPFSASLGLDERRARARWVERVKRWGLAVLVAAALLVLVVGLPWLIWRGPFVLDGKYIDRKALGEGSAALVTGLRTAMVAVVAALGAGIALLYTARTYRLTRRGQITDRFTKALERLGSPEIYVRIGGILALEQIVQDAPGQAATDAAHVLGHFIRHQAPRTRGPDDPATEPLPAELAADVQAALTALTRPESRTRVDEREELDLRNLHLAGARLKRADLTRAEVSGATLTGADLSGATLTGAKLTRATLTGADLSGATLTKADLSGATLTKAELSGATLTGAELSGATLTDAGLFGATLTGAKLTRTTLTGAELSGATLTKANLSGATLTGAELSGATLTKANLSGATLTGADLSGATLTKANLVGATLTGAYLIGATLTGAYLIGATLTDADLSGATLTDAKLAGTTLDGVVSNRATVWPLDFLLA